MQKVTNIQHKLKVLKDILTGEKDLNFLLPPRDYVVIQDMNGMYKIPDIDLLYGEEMFQQWQLKNIRERDHLIIFTCAPGCEPISLPPNSVIWNEERSYEDAENRIVETIDLSSTDYVEVDFLPAEIEIDEKHQRKTKRLKTPENEPQVSLQIIPKRLIHEGRLSEYGITWGSICE